MLGPVLEGERVRLEPPRPEYLPAYQRWFADMDVTRYLLYRFPFTAKAEEEWLEAVGKDPHQVLWAIVLRHNKPNAPRLDVLSDRAAVAPDDRLPRREKIGSNAGYFYAEDAAFNTRVQGNAALMKRLKNVRNEYIRVDRNAVSFFFAGSELEYGGLIRDHGDYYKMLNDLMDDLADLADAIS